MGGHHFQTFWAWTGWVWAMEGDSGGRGWGREQRTLAGSSISPPGKRGRAQASQLISLLPSLIHRWCRSKQRSCGGILFVTKCGQMCPSLRFTYLLCGSLCSLVYTWHWGLCSHSLGARDMFSLLGNVTLVPHCSSDPHSSRGQDLGGKMELP